MDEKNVLNDEALEAAAGGATAVNTTNPNGAHWQPTNVAMGSTFVQNGFLWYRIKSGDCLGAIAKTFNTTTTQLQLNNPATIKDVKWIYAGDAIIIRRA